MQTAEQQQMYAVYYGMIEKQAVSENRLSTFLIVLSCAT